jgi:hypothetical protein
MRIFTLLSMPITVLPITVLLFAGRSATLAAQAPAAETGEAAAAMGYSYVLPADWVPVAVKPHASTETAPQPSPAPPDTGPSENDKDPIKPAAREAIKETIRGNACIRVPLTAQHGTPASVIVVVELPFDCYGQTMTGQDLANFGSGAADGLKDVYDLLDPIFGDYSLGSHRLWIERAKASPRGHPETQYTIEIACSLLKKGAACWMTMAADEASLHAFESGPVTLEGETPTPLVPATAFDKAPIT